MEIVEQTWKELWGMSSYELSELHRTCSTYLTYIQENKDRISIQLSENLKKNISFSDTMQEYVAWLTLGPQLIYGYQTLVSIKMTKESISGEIVELSKLNEKTQNWKKATSYLEIDLPEEFTISEQDAYEGIKNSIENNKNHTVALSYYFGILRSKPDWKMPDCTGSSINLLTKKIKQIKSLPKPFPKYYDQMNWNNQERKILQKIIDEVEL